MWKRSYCELDLFHWTGKELIPYPCDTILCLGRAFKFRHNFFLDFLAETAKVPPLCQSRLSNSRGQRLFCLAVLSAGYLPTLWWKTLIGANKPKGLDDWFVKVRKNEIGGHGSILVIPVFYKQIMVTCMSYQSCELILIKRSKCCDTFLMGKKHSWISKSQLLGQQAKHNFSAFQHYFTHIINELRDTSMYVITLDHSSCKQLDFL